MISEAAQSLFIDRAGWLLIHSIWQFTLIAFVVSVILRLLSCKRTTSRHAVCLVGMGFVAAAPIATYMTLPYGTISHDTFGMDSISGHSASNDDGTVPVVSQKSGTENTALVIPHDIEAATGIVQSTSHIQASWGSRISEIVVPWFTPLVTLWCCGVLLFAFRPAWSLYTLSRLRRVGLASVEAGVAEVLARASQRLGMRSTPSVFESALVQVPMVMGYLKPIILLPASAISGLSTSELEAIFLHELAHIRRHDYIINLLQTLLETLFFYHPAVWWLSSILRCEREHCCDATAAERLGSHVIYGRALLKLEELQGVLPGLALGATHGSLLQRVQRLATVESQRPTRVGAAAVLVIALGLAVGLAWAMVSAKTALALDNTRETDKVSLVEEDADRPLEAKELAIRLHKQAAQIDTLPKFFIRAKAGTRTFKPMTNPSPQLLDNLMSSLDEPVVEEDWYRYEKTFAWDAQHFLDRMYATGAYAPDQPESKNPSGNPPSWHTRWGTADIGGERSQLGERPPTHVLRSGASEMWKDNGMGNPNYLLATTHKFWWGDNSYRHQCFSSIPPAVAEYRQLEEEEFDGELCDIIESPTRRERLWFSQKTGRLRGYLQSTYHGPNGAGDFHKSDVVRQIANKDFATHHEYLDWYRTEYETLPHKDQLRLEIAWLETKDFETARPSLLVRFRDYREVSPGVWWPFHEDRAQGHPSDDGYQCMRSTYQVQEVRTDFDLEASVRDLQPKEGEAVQDQRFEVPIKYKYKKGRTKEELLSMAFAAGQERLQSKKKIAQLKQPYQELVGKLAPKLPDETWVGGTRPDLEGKPYLIHSWAVWCGPCKNDYPMLNRMAKDGAIIIGLHPSGTDASEVKKAISEAGLSYPTLLDSSTSESEENRLVAGYPVSMYPYCVLVDSEGLVVDHGFLGEKNGALISKFRELREQSNVE